MAIAADLGVLLAVLFLTLCCTCLGSSLLSRLGIAFDSKTEHLLVSSATGFISFQVLLFFAELTQHIRFACVLVIVVLVISLLATLKRVRDPFIVALRETRPVSVFSRFLFVATLVVLMVEYLAATAPLTGSDALHYHFAVPKLIVESGFHPIFSNAHSFLCGQGHLLIVFGLALGSEKLSLALIFLGGLLTAVSLVLLVRNLTDGLLFFAAPLTFLLTPIVFWQICSSGAPDIWMAFYTTSAVIVLSQEKLSGTWQCGILVGFLAGAVAGTKYTGCVVAVSIALAFILECRAVLPTTLLFLSALAAGIWPYLRNLVWTRDPFFPFFSRVLDPSLFNAFSFAAISADTGSSGTRQFTQLFPFVFFAGLRSGNIGFWDFFGPVVLACAPLIVIAFRRSDRTWRSAAIVWSVTALGIFFTSGLTRFMLPVFPLGLCCVFGAIEFVRTRSWRIVHVAAVASVAVHVCAGLAGLVIYSRAPLAAALGLRNPAQYLTSTAQDFEVSQAINRLVQSQRQSGKTLVFGRHLYYLHIPYVLGDPDASWIVDPSRLQTLEQWTDFLSSQHVKFVVRAPSYPKAIAESLTGLERRGVLVPVAEVQAQNFYGMRIDENRISVTVTLLRVELEAMAPTVSQAQQLLHGAVMYRFTALPLSP
jgi:hypothetical protein